MRKKIAHESSLPLAQLFLEKLCDNIALRCQQKKN